MIQWQLVEFLGSRILPDSKFYTTMRGNLFDLLMIEMEPEDVGMYECRAINPAGTASDYAHVQMAGKERMGYGNSKNGISFLKCRPAFLSHKTSK